MEKIVSPKLYYRIFGALIVLTLVTVGVSFLDLGPFNIVVALGIAFTKAALVALYFMHARTSSRITQLFLGAGLLWLAILLVFTMSDFLSRGWLGTSVRSPGPERKL